MKITNKNPKVQILLATYNGENFLREQLDSIINQEYKFWELLIHDDGSNDNTIVILNEYQNNFPNKIRLLIDKKIFSSASKNFFHLIENRSREVSLYCLSDQDDIWHKSKLKFIVERYNTKEDKEPLLIHSDLSLIDDKGKLLENSHNKLINHQKNSITKNTTLYYNAVPGCALSINSALADKISYNKNMVMHDWWILLSAIYENTNVIYIDFPLVKYRQHSGNVLGYKKNNIFILVLRLFFKIPSYLKNVKKAYAQSKHFHDQNILQYFLRLVIHQVKTNL
jgi:glycosyltransferase involved in cell wall biosynthesis